MENKTSNIEEKISIIAVENLGVMVTSEFFIEVLKDLTKNIIIGTAEIALEKLNQTSGDKISGTLLTLIGGSTGSALFRIEKEIAETQNMILELQISVNSLITQVTNFFKQITAEILKSRFYIDMQMINKYYEKVIALQQSYLAIIDMCYDEKGDVKELTDYEKEKIDDAIIVFISNVGENYIPTMLTELNSMTNPKTGDSIYSSALGYFKTCVPFKHQMYGNMYALYNLIASIHTIGLDMYKEYESFKWLKDEKTTLTQEDWLENHYVPVYNSSISALNYQVENTPLINEMSTQLINITTDDPVKHLEDTINQKLAVVDEEGNHYLYDIFCIDSNAPSTASRYAVVKEALNLNCYETEETSGGGDTYHAVDSYFYNRLIYSSDHRYKAVDVASDLGALLYGNTGNDQIKYLVTNLPGLHVDGNGFVLNEGGKCWECKSTYLYTERYYAVKLLDANNYNANIAPTFIDGKKISSTRGINKNTQVSLLDTDRSSSAKTVYKKIGLKDMKFYIVFVDTNIKYSTIPIDAKTGYYKPIISREMPPDFNMDNGDVLDLSMIKGCVNGHNINVNGNATIIGGGSNNELNEMNINLYDDAVLTLENLHLVVSKDYKINVKTGTCTIITAGNSKLTGLVTPISSEIGANIIIKGQEGKENSLTVECTSDNPAISGDGDVSITGVSKLTVSSKGSTAIKTKGAFMAFSCAITSIVTKENKSITTDYYDDEIYGKLTIKTANVKNASTNSTVYFSIVHDCGKIEPLKCIDNNLKNDTLEKNSKKVFYANLGRASKVKNIEGIIIKSDHSGKAPGWKVESIKLENLNNIKQISLNFFPNLWIVNDQEKLFGLSEDTTGLFEFTVKTGSQSKSGTDSGLYVKIKGTNGSTDAQIISNITDYDAFENNNTDVFSVAYSKAIGIPQEITITTNASGKKPGWYCEYINIRLLVPNNEINGNEDTKKYCFNVNKFIKTKGEEYTFAAETVN
ncbi:PLAT/LH2 domain-containing protein [Clostridium tagluense]|uniref:PLAT/LH2 domain-containing protein n=1 Tax=Clostridium tagluense TaxID=360422 RepID=UPI001CF44800|nr:PLAT/LH2 domain-containing protein [Clostridium tagluense]MCB2300854.1 hypothetical protein [Clostridium tagluense]